MPRTYLALLGVVAMGSCGCFPQTHGFDVLCYNASKHDITIRDEALRKDVCTVPAAGAVVIRVGLGPAGNDYMLTDSETKLQRKLVIDNSFIENHLYDKKIVVVGITEQLSASPDFKITQLPGD